jgi:acyl-ACP thioesterase
MLEKKSVFTVSTYQCNSEGTIHLYSLMQQLQEIASKHAEDLGVGRKWMEENEYYWVLVDFKMEINRHPSYGETVIVKTWPSGWDLIKAFRDFKGEDLEGNELFRATSDWMVIERNSFKPMTTKELQFDFESSIERIIKDMERLKGSSQMQEITSLSVPFSSIDMNGHVNNTEYVRWGIDTLRSNITPGRKIRSFNISYLAEVFKGEIITFFSKETGPNTFMIKGSKKGSLKPAFVIEFKI